jgi:hypothetical protein
VLQFEFATHPKAGLIKAKEEMTKNRKNKYQLGSIVAIPLPDGRYSYARIFEDLMLGVYDHVTSILESTSVVTEKSISFFQGCTDKSIRSGEWPIIGEKPFDSTEESWAPPQATWYSRESNEWTTGTPKVNHRAGTHDATLDQVVGMDVMSFCQKPDLLIKIIMDRVIDKNHEPYRVRAS